MPVLEAHDIRKTFAEGTELVSVLRGVSLHLDRGEVVSLEGPSGSGKTTLLSILGCILSASGGDVIVEGNVVDRDDPSALQAVRKRSIGFVFQQFNLIPCLSAAENVEYALNIKGVKGRAARDEAARVLNEVGLAAKCRSMPRDLSGGQKQRVAVARALAGRSPILLVDEPTANLDAQSAEQVLNLFQSLARTENRGILIVTHDPKVRAVVNRVLTIHEGLLSTEPNAGQAQPLKGLWGSGPEDARGSSPRTPSTTPPRREPPRRFAPEPFSMT